MTDRAWADYSERFRREVLPRLLSSAFCLSIHSDREDFDVEQATEIGATLLLGKPMLVVIPRGRSLPAGLRRAADVVIDDFDITEVESQERLRAAIEGLQRKD